MDVPSVSGSEGPLADAVEAALRDLDHLEVLRHGNTVVARTHLGRPQRVVVAGHLDTVPVSLRSRNVPGRREERDGQEVVWGRGSVDMKGGVAVALHLAATLTHPGKDVTWVLYDNEEVAAHLNGLGRVLATHPDWLAGDLAVLGEPTASRIEGGCNGTLRLVLDVRGVTAHSARAWRGVNAVHAAAPLIQRVATAPVHEVEVEGLVFRESFSVVGIQGGTASFQGLALSFPIRYSVSVDGSQQAAFTYNDSSLNDGAHLLATVLLPAGVKDLLKIDGKTVKREDALRRLANAEPETASEPEAKPVKPLENPDPIADVLEKKQEQAAEKPEDKPTPPPAKAETPSAKEAEALSPEEPESRISQGEIDQARRAHASAGQSLKSAWKNIDPTVQQSLVEEQREWESKKNRNCAKAAAKGIPKGTEVGEGVRLALKNLLK